MLPAFAAAAAAAAVAVPTDDILLWVWGDLGWRALSDELGRLAPGLSPILARLRGQTPAELMSGSEREEICDRARGPVPGPIVSRGAREGKIARRELRWFCALAVRH